MKKILALTAALWLAGCAWPPWQPPNPEPTPTPPPWECPLAAEMPGCHETDPPLTCGECWHNPTTNPEHCEKAPDCPIPPDPPDPPPVPEPGCEPNYPVPDEWDEAALVAHSDPAAQYHEEFLKVTTALGDRRDCTPPQNLDAVAAEIYHNLGKPTIRGIEAVFVLRTDGLWEENHIVSFGNSGWTNSGRGRYMGSHSWDAPDDTCTAPLPDLTRMLFKCKEHNGILDCTWTTVNQPDFCNQIGFPCMPGHGTSRPCDPPSMVRGGCPIRPEGHPLRVICEAEKCNQKWECNGVAVGGWKGNPAQSNCRGHWKTWCSAPGSTAQAEGDR